ncbi:MAG: DUF4442 domain-containing protein [Pseudomonadota bacterium]
MPESLKSRIIRWRFNVFPALRGTGGKVTYVADDLKEIHVKLPLTWRTKNYVGTLFGGSMFGVVDAFYMVMFINLLGKAYIVWDKSATIYFKKPGRSTLRAKFIITDDELDSIRDVLETERKLERTYSVDLVDEDGVVCATVDKLLYFRRREKPSDPS